MWNLINQSSNFFCRKKIHLTNTKMATTLTLFDRSNKSQVAHITYYMNTEDSEAFIGYLDVVPGFQGRGFGKMMIVLMLADLMYMRDNSVTVKYIRLDDCSDMALQKRSLYFKLGFRIANARNPETMTVFIGDGKRERNYYTYENGTMPVSNVYKDVGEFVGSIIGRYALDKGCVTWTGFGENFMLKKSVENIEVEDGEDFLAMLLGKLGDVKLIRYVPRMCALYNKKT